LTIQGVVDACTYVVNAGGLNLAIGKGEVAAVVARTFDNDPRKLTPYTLATFDETRRERFQALLPTPRYPAEALAGGISGQAIVTVQAENVRLAQSAGNERLDEAALRATQLLGGNRHLFQGEHRFNFEILER
jgi:TonB family protein